MPDPNKSKKRPSPSPASEAGPMTKKKKKAGGGGGKMGRPPNVQAPIQLEEMMKGAPDYVKLKKKPDTSTADVTKFFDGKAYDFIAKYGWEDPFRTLTKDVDDATEVARNLVKAEVEAAKSGTEVNAEKKAEQTKKYELWKLVRSVRTSVQPDVRVLNSCMKEFTKLYQRAVREGTIPEVDIPKLLKTILARPTQQRLYTVWAKQKKRLDLESEVDQRYAAAVKEDGEDATSRGAIWDAVASEWYDVSSEDEKIAANKEALKILEVETKKWEQHAATEPSSPEEAHE